MVIKAQFNPSTLKAMYNPATGKQIAYDTESNECPALCGANSTPKLITVNITELVDCPCTWRPTTHNYRKAEGVAASINGNDYILPWNSYDGTPGAEVCWWYKAFAGSFGTHKIYDDDGCENLIQTIIFDSLRVYFQRRVNIIYLQLLLYDDYPAYQHRPFVGDNADFSDCVEGSIDNDYVEASCGSYDVPCHSGTAVIIAGK